MSFKVLTRTEARIVESIGQALFPKDGAIPVDAREARVVEYIDRYLTLIPAQERVMIRAMFGVFAVGMLAPRDARAPWQRMTAGEREDWLYRWERSRFYPRRALFYALRSVFTMAYTADPAVVRGMGIEPGATWMARDRSESAPQCEPEVEVEVSAAAGGHDVLRLAPPEVRP